MSLSRRGDDGRAAAAAAMAAAVGGDGDNDESGAGAGALVPAVAKAPNRFVTRWPRRKLERGVPAADLDPLGLALAAPPAGSEEEEQEDGSQVAALPLRRKRGLDVDEAAESSFSARLPLGVHSWPNGMPKDGVSEGWSARRPRRGVPAGDTRGDDVVEGTAPIVTVGKQLFASSRSQLSGPHVM